jgi:protein O-mannosyl-transferase
LSHNPDSAETHNNLGCILAGSGQADQAILHYEKALTIDPNHAVAHFNFGAALVGRGQIDEAIAHFKKALEINPQHAQARKNIEQAIALREKSHKAMAKRREWIRANPNDADALNDTAWILATSTEASLRNGAEAVEFAQRAVALSGGQKPAILNTLAAAFAEAGRFPEAIQTAKKAAKLAMQQNKPYLADFIREKIRLYEAKTPFRDIPQTSSH